jgi:hypothetical protein
MRIILIIGASVSCAIGLLMAWVIFGHPSFNKTMPMFGWIIWSTYVLLAIAPLVVLRRPRPQQSRKLQFAIAGVLEIVVVGLFLLMVSLPAL